MSVAYDDKGNPVYLESDPDIPLPLAALLIVESLLLVALAVFILRGAGIVPFHGDESMQIYMANDYRTLFSAGRADQLLSYPPFDIDSDAHLRLINGSVNRYAIGFMRQFSGLEALDPPLPRPGWDWGLSYADNIATAHRLSDTGMFVARLPSGFFTIGAMLLVFAIGRRLGGWRTAWVAAILFALHPVLLLNGRRALQEGAMLFFGLLAVAIGQRMTETTPRSRLDHIGLAVVSALALASKHSAIVFVAAAFVWALLPLRGWRLMARRIGALTLTGAAAIALFIVFSPALWSDPVARIGDLLAKRAELLTIQVSIAGGEQSIADRATALVVQPLLAPPQFYELDSFREPLADAIAAYLRSPLSGIVSPIVWGVVGVLAIIGLVRLRGTDRWGLLLWLAITAAALMANPLAWQRYYVPLIPILTLAAGAAVAHVPRRQKQKPNETPKTKTKPA